MWSGTRDMIIGRHEFYVQQVKQRVLSQFQDIEGEANRHAESEYQRLGSMPGSEHSDMSQIAEVAGDRAQERYGLLADLKKQQLLGALAGMYHQWDKDLRDFLEREFQTYYQSSDVEKVVWKSNVSNLLGLLCDQGWDCRGAGFFPLIDACRLVVNVYKHGKGASLKDLDARYPEYLNRPLSGLLAEETLFAHMTDHEWLEVSEEQFDVFADAFRSFWKEFPERLSLN